MTTLEELVAIMAMRPGITVGGGIERGPAPVPEPVAEVEHTPQVEQWHARNDAERHAEENMRKMVSKAGGRYVKPRAWTPEERARLQAWRKQCGHAPVGTGITGRVNGGGRSF